MATKLTVNFGGFADMIDKLDRLQGDIGKTTEQALKASHKIVTEKVEKAVQKSNLPAKGKYSTGKTADSIVKDDNVKWDGTTASVDVGFDFKKGGMTSIYLMYGTPRMKPAKGLKAAIYGSAVKKEIKEKQKEIFAKAIKEKMEG